jgi:hypothetical protein
MVCCLFVGCGKEKPTPPPLTEVSGVVTIDGEPLKRVRVRFMPSGEFNSEYTASGLTDDEGKFTLSCRGQDGGCVGENTVVIQESEIPDNLRGESKRQDVGKYYESLGGRPIPVRYTRLVDSPLVVNVTPNKKNYSIALTRE